MKKVYNSFVVDRLDVASMTFGQKRKIIKEYDADLVRRSANGGYVFYINEDHDYYELDEFMAYNQPEKYDQAGVYSGIKSNSYFTWDELIISNCNADKCVILQCYDKE